MCIYQLILQQKRDGEMRLQASLWRQGYRSGNNDENWGGLQKKKTSTPAGVEKYSTLALKDDAIRGTNRR